MFSHPRRGRLALGPADEGGGGSLWALPGDRGSDVGTVAEKTAELMEKDMNKSWNIHEHHIYVSYIYT